MVREVLNPRARRQLASHYQKTKIAQISESATIMTEWHPRRWLIKRNSPFKNSRPETIWIKRSTSAKSHPERINRKSSRSSLRITTSLDQWSRVHRIGVSWLRNSSKAPQSQTSSTISSTTKASNNNAQTMNSNARQTNSSYCWKISRKLSVDWTWPSIFRAVTAKTRTQLSTLTAERTRASKGTCRRSQKSWMIRNAISSLKWWRGRTWRITCEQSRLRRASLTTLRYLRLHKSRAPKSILVRLIFVIQHFSSSSHPQISQNPTGRPREWMVVKYK